MKENNKNIFIEGGFYLTPRKKFDSDLWKDRDKCRFFDFLVGRANHDKQKPQRSGYVTVGHGQYLRSYRKLCEDLAYVENHQVKQYSLSQLKRMIDKLVREDRITAEKTELGTLFSICNYHIYQEPNSYKRPDVEQRENSGRTPEEHRRNNNNNSKHSKNSDNLLGGKQIEKKGDRHRQRSSHYSGKTITC